MMGGKSISIMWKIIIFLFSFGIVLFVSLRLKLWSGDFTRYFILTGNWGMIILLLMIGYIVSEVLTKLLMWQFRIETRPAKRRGHR